MSRTPGESRRAPRAVAVVLAAVPAIGVNALVAGAARSAGVPADFRPLQLQSQAIVTTVALVAAVFVWEGVRRRARDPRRTMRLLVPPVFLLSLVPDAFLFGSGGGVGVVASMVTHLVVAGAGVTAHAWALLLRSSTNS